MIGEKLLDKFSEYDLKEVDNTFANLAALCAELHDFERGRKKKLNVSLKWKELFQASEDLDYIFFED